MGDTDSDPDPTTNCPDLKLEAAQNQLLLSKTETAIGSKVNVTCAVDGSSLDGESDLTCQDTGQWSSDLPTCSASGLSDREVVVIAASCSVILVVLIVLIIVVVLYYRTKARNRQKRNDRLTATLERLSIRDPLDELVRRESRRSSFGCTNPAFTATSGEDVDGEKRLEVPAPLSTPTTRGGANGVQLSRQTLSTWHYPTPNNRVQKSVYSTHNHNSTAGGIIKHRDSSGIRLLKLYKIWDSTRTRKQFVFAENIDELIVKGGEKLSLSGPIRVVLEEDGTEVDNDAVLRACAGMVLLLLEQTQVWTKPEVLLSVHEYSNSLNHYRYDIDEKL